MSKWARRLGTCCRKNKYLARICLYLFTSSPVQSANIKHTKESSCDLHQLFNWFLIILRSCIQFGIGFLNCAWNHSLENWMKKWTRHNSNGVTVNPREPHCASIFQQLKNSEFYSSISLDFPTVSSIFQNFWQLHHFGPVCSALRSDIYSF